MVSYLFCSFHYLLVPVNVCYCYVFSGFPSRQVTSHRHYLVKLSTKRAICRGDRIIRFAREFCCYANQPVRRKKKKHISKCDVIFMSTRPLTQLQLSIISLKLLILWMYHTKGQKDHSRFKIRNSRFNIWNSKFNI